MEVLQYTNRNKKIRLNMSHIIKKLWFYKSSDIHAFTLLASFSIRTPSRQSYEALSVRPGLFRSPRHVYLCTSNTICYLLSDFCGIFLSRILIITFCQIYPFFTFPVNWLLLREQIFFFFISPLPEIFIYKLRFGVSRH